MSDAAGSRVLTVPNALSVGRLLCAPVFIWMVFVLERPLLAAAFLGVLGATDWVDGFVARRFNQTSEIGKVLDPTADRILLGVAMVAIALRGAVPAIVWVPALAREVLVSAGAIVVAMLGGRRMDVQFAGKAGTFSLMWSFPFFLVSSADIWWDFVASAIAWGFAVAGLGFGWYAAVTYVPLARVAIREGRADAST